MASYATYTLILFSVTLSFFKSEITLAIFGLDNAGKTTTVNSIRGGSVKYSTPTVGFSVSEFAIENFNINLYDVGGGDSIRNIWKTYYAELFGVVFVVDASLPSRIEECRTVLANLLSHPKISGKPILLLANKKDLLESMTEAEVIEALNLEVLVNAYQCPCRVECCSAIKGTGRHTDKAIKLGLRWILSLIESELVSLRARVSADMQEQANADAKEREKRKQRVKKAREERNRLETKLAASLQEATADATSSMGPAKIAAERSFNIIGDSTTASVSGEDGLSGSIYSHPATDFPGPHLRRKSHDVGDSHSPIETVSSFGSPVRKHNRSNRVFGRQNFRSRKRKQRLLLTRTAATRPHRTMYSTMDTIEELDEENLGSPRPVKFTLETTSPHKEGSQKLSDDSLEFTEVGQRSGTPGTSRNGEVGLSTNSLGFCPIENPQKTIFEHRDSGTVQNDYTVIASQTEVHKDAKGPSSPSRAVKLRRRTPITSPTKRTSQPLRHVKQCPDSEQEVKMSLEILANTEALSQPGEHLQPGSKDDRSAVRLNDADNSQGQGNPGMIEEDRIQILEVDDDIDVCTGRKQFSLLTDSRQAGTGQRGPTKHRTGTGKPSPNSPEALGKVSPANIQKNGDSTVSSSQTVNAKREQTSSPTSGLIPRKQRTKKALLDSGEDSMRPLEIIANLEPSMRPDDQVESGRSTETLVSMKSQSGSRQDLSKDNKGRIEVQEVDEEIETQFQRKNSVPQLPKKAGNVQLQDDGLLTKDNSSTVKNLPDVAERKDKTPSSTGLKTESGRPSSRKKSRIFIPKLNKLHPASEDFINSSERSHSNL